MNSNHDCHPVPLLSEAQPDKYIGDNIYMIYFGEWGIRSPPSLNLLLDALSYAVEYYQVLLQNNKGNLKSI